MVCYNRNKKYTVPIFSEASFMQVTFFQRALFFKIRYLRIKNFQNGNKYQAMICYKEKEKI